MRSPWNPDMDNYLKATPFFDYDHAAVAAWLQEQLAGVPDDPVEQMKVLYLAVRDGIQYNPYVFRAEPRTLSAGYALQSGESYCIPKAILLGAAARALGIPSRLGLADVRNHLSSPKLIEWLQSDVFRMHGFIELYLNGRWVKATPAFNQQLCQMMKVDPLEFDGVNDSVFRGLTKDAPAHMDSTTATGSFDDVPYAFILPARRAAIGHLSSRQAKPSRENGSWRQTRRGGL